MAHERDSDESRRILDRVSRESDIAGGFVAQQTDRLRDHLSASDADQNDAIEVWGTRIGRTIALAAMAGCVVWLAWYLSQNG